MQLDASLVGVSSSQQTGELYKALVKAQKGFKPIKRSGLNRAEGFRYATFADICEGTVPSLLEAGLSQPTFSMGFDKTIGRWVLVGTLCHGESDQWVSAVCPLMIGFPEGSRPGIQDLEIDNTYAKKILMGNLVGGWLESEAEEAPAPAPVEVQASAPAMVPVKQAPKAKSVPLSADAKKLIARADEKLATLTEEKHQAERDKVYAYLDTLVASGTLPQSEVTLLRTKHTLGGTVTKVVERPAEKAKREVPGAK